MEELETSSPNQKIPLERVCVLHNYEVLHGPYTKRVIKPDGIFRSPMKIYAEEYYTVFCSMCGDSKEIQVKKWKE
jgi:hypothetical protein